MATHNPSILIFGTTGYLGGAILVATLNAFPDAKISAIVRHDKQNALLEAAGVASVLRGGTENVQELQKIVSEFDIVVNAADADDLILVNAIIAGLATRKERSGKRPVFLHISGAYVVSDASEGVWNPNFKYISDKDEAALRAIPPTAVHRHTELKVYEADAAGHIDGYQICPGAVWGSSPGPVRKDSVLLMQTYLSVFGKGLVIEQGTNRMPTVHVEDLADLVVLVLRRAVSGVDTDASAYAKYYFASTREEQQKDLAAATVGALVKLGKLDHDEVKNVGAEEASTYFKYAVVLVTNWVVRAERGETIGWNPTRLGSVTDAMVDHLRPFVAT
ncbi:hypothetical protein BKA62DRAFT_717841 [Auriculariales sp. MPI-PUGE-AT-0066]|nr:hypothetical protein BKA62DRAFT_717841 [Auriculariales sp. MPI-PUGE-AT-0066]